MDWISSDNNSLPLDDEGTVAFCRQPSYLMAVGCAYPMSRRTPIVGTTSQRNDGGSLEVSSGPTDYRMQKTHAQRMHMDYQKPSSVESFQSVESQGSMQNIPGWDVATTFSSHERGNCSDARNTGIRKRGDEEVEWPPRDSCFRNCKQVEFDVSLRGATERPKQIPRAVIAPMYRSDNVVPSSTSRFPSEKFSDLPTPALDIGGYRQKSLPDESSFVPGIFLADDDSDLKPFNSGYPSTRPTLFRPQENLIEYGGCFVEQRNEGNTCEKKTTLNSDYQNNCYSLDRRINPKLPIRSDDADQRNAYDINYDEGFGYIHRDMVRNVLHHQRQQQQTRKMREPVEDSKTARTDRSRVDGQFGHPMLFRREEIVSSSSFGSIDCRLTDQMRLKWSTEDEEAGGCDGSSASSTSASVSSVSSPCDSGYRSGDRNSASSTNSSLSAEAFSVGEESPPVYRSPPTMPGRQSGQTEIVLRQPVSERDHRITNEFAGDEFRKLPIEPILRSNFDNELDVSDGCSSRSSSGFHCKGVRRMQAIGVNEARRFVNTVPQQQQPKTKTGEGRNCYTRYVDMLKKQVTLYHMRDGAKSQDGSVASEECGASFVDSAASGKGVSKSSNVVGESISLSCIDLERVTTKEDFQQHPSKLYGSLYLDGHPTETYSVSEQAETRRRQDVRCRNQLIVGPMTHQRLTSDMPYQRDVLIFNDQDSSNSFGQTEMTESAFDRGTANISVERKNVDKPNITVKIHDEYRSAESSFKNEYNGTSTNPASCEESVNSSSSANRFDGCQSETGKKMRTKKSVTFSDSVTLIVDDDDDNDLPENGLIDYVEDATSFLQKRSQNGTIFTRSITSGNSTDVSTVSSGSKFYSDADETNFHVNEESSFYKVECSGEISETDSEGTMVDEVGKVKCSLCQKRWVDMTETYCRDCHFYMSKLQAA